MKFNLRHAGIALACAASVAAHAQTGAARDADKDQTQAGEYKSGPGGIRTSRGPAIGGSGGSGGPSPASANGAAGNSAAGGASSGDAGAGGAGAGGAGAGGAGAGGAGAGGGGG